MRIWISSVTAFFLATVCTQQSVDARENVAPRAGAASSSAASPQKALPDDVSEFIEIRNACDHWRGEYSDYEERNKQINKAVQETCTGSDAKLSALRKKYRSNAAVIKALADYEDKIEF